ncbi:LysM domain-containing protein [Paramyrothecium foliicola]|nr:LysM domain-containing protein [Paramyrothecium foliicola]
MLRQLPVLLCLVTARLGFCAVAGTKIQGRGEEPRYEFDPATTKYCSYWIDYIGGGLQCSQIPAQWEISMADFLRWNPSLAPDCQNIKVSRSYCVEVAGEPAPTSSSAAPSPTKPSNGIETPEPIQPGMVDNCDKFYLIPRDSGCEDAAAKNGITIDEFHAWNPLVGKSCAGLWAEVFVCVSIIGHTPKPSSTSGTPTGPTNGVNTPLPIQPNMVNNCDKFHFVAKGQTCDEIVSKNGISMAQFIAWNKAVGPTCGGLWAEAHACVSIIGHEPTPTQPGNGVTTPSPIQAGMVGNCKKFYFVQDRETCQTIATKFSITVANFVKWNPAVGPTCSGLWSKTYACIGV